MADFGASSLRRVASCFIALVVSGGSAGCAAPEPPQPVDGRQARQAEPTSSTIARPSPPPSATVSPPADPTPHVSESADALPRLDGVPCDEKFCIRAVNDTIDPFQGIDPATLPAAVTIEQEHVSLGTEQRVARNYLVFQSKGAARAKLEAELTKRFGPALPRDHLLLFQLDSEGRGRSYIGGPGLVNASHLAEVAAVRDTFSGGYQVQLKLTDDGKSRFGAATEAMTRRRIAIVVGGEAKSVPLVMEKISGGTTFLSVTDKRDAEALAKALAP